MKIWKKLYTILVWMVAVFAVGIMIFTIVSVSTFDRSERSLFGYKAFIVLSDSMSKTDFQAGDLVLVKETDPTTLKEGDIIAYTSQNESNYGETVTHKIRSITSNEEGEPGFITYGTTTDMDDETIVTYPYILGKYEKCIPKIGSFFQYLKTTPGYIMCIFLPFFILIMMEGFRSVQLFQKYRREQQEELQAEREQLRSEREETQKMMQELMQMREQLEKVQKSEHTEL